MTDGQQLPRFTLRVERRVLRFRVPARTSKGALRERTVYYVHAETADRRSTGECCTMPHLSPEVGADYEQRLLNTCRAVEAQQCLLPNRLRQAPSMLFGLETALQGLLPHPRYNTPVARGEAGILIHHLVWMDTAEKMLEQMANGIARGFTCLKMKIGALPFEEERELLREAHRRYPRAELRVDANGAFPTPAAACTAMEQLAECGVSLIEQPLPWGRIRQTAELAALGILPLALDEELIAANTDVARARLLDEVKPQGIVIKPSLHGGLSGAETWAALAEERGIRHWVNSALESHVGLRALVQWCGLHAPRERHGLGTGMLYENDTPATELRNDRIYLI